MHAYLHKFEVYKNALCCYPFEMSTVSEVPPQDDEVLRAFSECWPASCNPDDPLEGRVEWVSSRMIDLRAVVGEPGA